MMRFGLANPLKISDRLTLSQVLVVAALIVGKGGPLSTMTYSGQMRLVSTCEVDLDVLEESARALLVVECGNGRQLGTTDIVELGDKWEKRSFFGIDYRICCFNRYVFTWIEFTNQCYSAVVPPNAVKLRGKITSLVHCEIHK